MTYSIIRKLNFAKNRKRRAGLENNCATEHEKQNEKSEVRIGTTLNKISQSGNQPNIV